MARRQNPKIERTLKRASSLKLVKQTFLIVCEGEVTEPEYFNSFRLNTAIQMAQANGFQVAYSNQAFEYWFLLHFNLYQGSIHRSHYAEIPICLVSDTVRQKGTP